MIKRLIWGGLLATAWQAAEATPTTPRDTTKVIDIESVVVVASPKEHVMLRQQALSSSVLSRQDLEARQVTSLKGLTSLVPNFYMPDYGSKLTSALYIRGIGSRINTPAVGLYVDNVPYLDKSAFDFNLYDIERIDVLRGPQSTLYGRGAMGGLMKVHTRNPFRYQGTNLELGVASGNNAYRTSLTHYHRISRHFAFSVGGFYEGARGFFRNEMLGRYADPLQSGGGRIRAIWLPDERWRLDFTAHYEHSNEGGYAYGLYNKGTRATEPIRSNEESTYRRGVLNSGLSATWHGDAFTLTSVTGYQRLDDRMYIDQDFLPISLYTLEQKQQLNSFSEELTLKSLPGQRWQWVTGVFASYQNLRTASPVFFHADGMQMLESTINKAMSSDKIPQQILTLGLDFPGTEMPIYSDFRTPTVGAALFHQSTLENLLVDGLSLTLGLRLDYEHVRMQYFSGGEVDYGFDFNLKMMSPVHIRLNDRATSRLDGDISDHYLQWLPKASLRYDFNERNNLYFTVSKGYRSGGYNIQMFSDLAQNSLQNAMMGGVKNGLFARFDALVANGQMPAKVAAMGKQMLEQYIPANRPEIDVQSATYYRPEYSWNYEIGTHLTLWNGKVHADLSAFLLSTRDQQISRFVDSGLGRISVNAGRSRSLGAEASIHTHINRHLNLNMGYGYTRATFREYNLGQTENGTYTDYAGRTVPFVPRHTLSAGGSYTFYLQHPTWQSITLLADYQGIGDICWTEQNDTRQGYYGTWNGGIRVQTPLCEVHLWARNLTDKQYHAFYFESMGNGFAQMGTPRRFGLDLRWNF